MNFLLQMQNRDKISKEVAQKLGVSISTVTKVMASQSLLVKETIMSKKPRSIYFRKLGTFVGPKIKAFITTQKIENSKKRVKSKNIQDPFEF